MSDLELHDILLIAYITLLAFYPIKGLILAIKERDAETTKWRLGIISILAALIIYDYFFGDLTTRSLNPLLILTYLYIVTWPHVSQLKRGIKGKNRGRIIKYSIIVAIESIVFVLLFIWGRR